MVGWLGTKTEEKLSSSSGADSHTIWVSRSVGLTFEDESCVCYEGDIFCELLLGIK